MSQAYRIVFACPKGGHNINLQRKHSNLALSEIDAMKSFGGENLSCESPKCGWRGKASQTKLLRIVPFDWIFSIKYGDSDEPAPIPEGT
jgi:hypothetical protein